MRKISLFMATALVAGSTAIAETTPSDEGDAIKKTALDYIEGAGTPAMRREWNGRCIRNWRNEWFRRTR
jgi:hypothetical protein